MPNLRCVLLFILASAFLPISCGPSGPTKCESTSDCLSGEYCTRGECSDNQCLTNNDCDSGLVCEDGKCKAKEQTCNCTSDQVCENGKCVQKTPPSNITPQEYCNRSAPLLCKVYYKCLSQEKLRELEGNRGFKDQEGCGKVYATLCEGEVVQGVKKGWRKFNSENAAKCLADHESHPCTAPGPFPASCADVTEGTRKWKEECAYNGDCLEVNATCRDKLCTDSLNAAALQKDCSELTAKECPGNICINLNPNLQNKTGICTASCNSHSDCPQGDGAKCVKIQENTNYCLIECKTDSDCQNGFVCNEGYCFVKIK